MRGNGPAKLVEERVVVCSLRRRPMDCLAGHAALAVSVQADLGSAALARGRAGGFLVIDLLSDCTPRYLSFGALADEARDMAR